MVVGTPGEALCFWLQRWERELLALRESQVNLPFVLHFLITLTYKWSYDCGHSSGGHQSLPMPNPEGREPSLCLLELCPMKVRQSHCFYSLSVLLPFSHICEHSCEKCTTGRVLKSQPLRTKKGSSRKVEGAAKIGERENLGKVNLSKCL